jgi:hypothetical protein
MVSELRRFPIMGFCSHGSAAPGAGVNGNAIPEALVSTKYDGRTAFIWRNRGETDEQALEPYYQCHPKGKEVRHAVTISWAEDSSTIGAQTNLG